MARKAYGLHATQVNTSTYADDPAYPIGSNEWNEDLDPAGMLGFTPATANSSTIIIASGVATITDSVSVIAGEGATTDTLQKLALTNTNEYDLVYLFAASGSYNITLEHGDLNADGEISTVSGSNETLSTTVPTILMRKGNYWYGYGGGVVNAVSDIGDVTISSIGSGELLKWNGSAWINQTLAESGIAASGAKLSDFAATSSSELAGTISDETGSGALVFATSPTLVTPALGTPASGVLTNCTALPAAQVAQGTMASGMVLVAPALGTPASGVATNLTGTAASLTAGTATVATTVTITDNESTNESNALIFTAGGDVDGGNIGLESDGDLTYNPSTGTLSATALTLSGDLTVNGTTTTINSTTLTVDDKNIEMGSVSTPSDTTADGGGITLKGATDKTIIWDNANDNWTSNQDWNIATGKVFKVNNVSTLTATALGSAVVGSSLTSVGTLTGLTLSGALSGTDVALSGRLKTDKGADVASATAMTLGADGNTFDITGTTTIVTIPSTNWAVGNIVHLQFDGVLTVTHSSATDSILLGDQSNMTTAAGDVLSLFFNGTNWVEISRSVVAAAGGATATHDFTKQAHSYTPADYTSSGTSTTRYLHVRPLKLSSGAEDTNNEGVFIRIKKNGTHNTEVQIA